MSFYDRSKPLYEKTKIILYTCFNCNGTGVIRLNPKFLGGKQCPHCKGTGTVEIDARSLAYNI